ncbi:MAG TPA: MFS transporter [Cellulomonas sp.]
MDHTAQTTQTAQTAQTAQTTQTTRTGRPVDGPGGAGPRSGAIVGVLALAGVLAAGMQTLVVPLIGQLPSILGTSTSSASWVITVTLLASAVAVPIAGRLGDMFGKKRLLLVSIVPLLLGSAVCALSGTLVPMLVGRGLQGLGMGVVPLGISLLRDVVPPERVGSAVALMSASMGIGGAFGLPFAAAIAQTASWQVMFWVFAGLSAVTLLAVWRVVPAGPAHGSGQRFDPWGAVLLCGGLVCFLLAVSKGAVWGWTAPATLGCGAAAVLVLSSWVLVQLRVRQPLVNVRSIARRPVLVTNVASLLVSFAMYAQALVIPQLLQLPSTTGYGLGQSMLAMALWLAPGGLVMMAVAPLGARVSRVRGPRTTLVAGAVAIAAAYGAGLVLMGSTWGLMVVVMLVNVGTGLAYGAVPLLIMRGVPRAETGAANSFNTLVRSVGTSVAAAVVGVLLANMSTLVDGVSVPSEGAFRVALLVGCAAGIVAAVVAAAIPGSSTTGDGAVDRAPRS